MFGNFQDNFGKLFNSVTAAGHKAKPNKDFSQNEIKREQGLKQHVHVMAVFRKLPKSISKDRVVLTHRVSYWVRKVLE